jgi:hypothetical protein
MRCPDRFSGYVARFESFAAIKRLPDEYAISPVSCWAAIAFVGI